ncbi:MAG TPA: HAMP domain-containing sensor histidine kinase [Candidatus Pacearchaeota archaeon]|nr:HAMP domain-containing sensor histidine kinase [Candidatus Pacearchaeota archaeon]
MNYLKDYEYKNVFDEFKKLSPFVSDYFSKKFNLYIEVYDIRKNLLSNAYNDEQYYVYQDIYYAINGMKNYIIKSEEDKKILFFSSPIFYNNEVIGAVRFIYPMNSEFALIYKIKITLVIISILAIFLSLILNYFFSNTITKPIEKLKYETEKIANGDLSTRIDIESNEEINSLVNSFNIMVEKLEHYIQSLNEEKERQKIFTDNITHELKTPITAILGHADLIQRLTNEEDKEISLNYIISEGNRLLKLVEELLEISRINKDSLDFDFKNHNIKELVEECLGILDPRFKKFGIMINNDTKEKVLVFDYEKIKQVVLNVLDNAIVHSKCSEIKITSEIDKDYYYLIIQDNGVGIDEKIQERLFNPFFTPKKQRSFGLGLYISKEIMKKHNGDINVISQINKGTRVILKLPLNFEGEYY